MFEGVALRTFVPLLLRAGLAVVFIYHGLEKVEPGRSYGWNWMPDGSLSAPLQMLVAWGELLGGVAVALGILTRPAAIGLIIIMVGAIFSVTGGHGFGLFAEGKFQGGYEYNFVLIVMAAALALSGAGTISLDRVIHLKMRGPAKY